MIGDSHLDTISSLGQRVIRFRYRLVFSFLPGCPPFSGLYGIIEKDIKLPDIISLC